MNNKIKYRWFSGILLFIGFVLCFFLDFTGLLFHMIFGIILGLAVFYHLLDHWRWIRSVCKQLTNKKQGKSRTFLFLDFSMFIGFIIILSTGIMMSGWISHLPLHYHQIKVLHSITSIITLVILVIKMVAHAPWLIINGKKILNIPVASSAPACNIERREFLKMAVLLGGVTMIAITKPVKSILQDLSIENSASVQGPLPTPGSTIQPTNAPAQPTETIPPAEPTIAQNTPAEAAPTLIPPTVQPMPISQPETCTVLCSRHCSYPGACRRYIDRNQNGLCDNGECL